MNKKHFIFFTVFFWCALNSYAGIRPSFSLDYCAWNATHIVIATEGEEIDGNFAVLESLKGDLGFGESISIQELSNFNSESSRQVKQSYSETPIASKYVTGAKMILFLRKNPTSKAIWESADFYKDFKVSVIWIEGEKTFAFIQTMNPGDSILVEFGKTEIEIRSRIFEINEIENSLNDVLKIENKTERAEELQDFVASDFYLAQKKAFDELKKCGENALPVLRKILKDQSLLEIHPDAIETLAMVGGKKVGNELTEIVKEEMSFWKETAPKLSEGWWNDINNPDTEILRNRYSKVLEAIYQLKNIKFRNCKKVVTQFRDFWRSLPQLEDKGGLNQMSEECDKLLQELKSKNRTQFRKKIFRTVYTIIYKRPKYRKNTIQISTI